jgi:hypothetical protein
VPCSALDIIRASIALDDGPEVDIENARVPVAAGALRPVEIAAVLDGERVLEVLVLADDILAVSAL